MRRFNFFPVAKNCLAITRYKDFAAVRQGQHDMMCVSLFQSQPLQCLQTEIDVVSRAAPASIAVPVRVEPNMRFFLYVRNLIYRFAKALDVWTVRSAATGHLL